MKQNVDKLEGFLMDTQPPLNKDHPNLITVQLASEYVHNCQPTSREGRFVIKTISCCGFKTVKPVWGWSPATKADQTNQKYPTYYHFIPPFNSIILLNPVYQYTSISTTKSVLCKLCPPKV